jgi:rSAM/selenodomain-associated transferase 1
LRADSRAEGGTRRSRRTDPRPSPALLVLAKAPVPGRVKTRLTPPCTPQQAAALARAALEDTLAAVAASTRPARRVLVLDGRRGPWVPPGFAVVAQRGEGLAARLAAAFADAGAPALLVGMDTPQVTPDLLDAGLDALGAAAVDACFGAATDGGYWAIGLRRADPAVFRGVPMSAPNTGAVQAARLRALGLRTATLPPLRDVDTIADARAVAALAPHGRFAAALAALPLGEGLAA